jgi:hypothetical protein
VIYYLIQSLECGLHITWLRFLPAERIFFANPIVEPSVPTAIPHDHPTTLPPDNSTTTTPQLDRPTTLLESPDRSTNRPTKTTSAFMTIREMAKPSSDHTSVSYLDDLIARTRVPTLAEFEARQSLWRVMNGGPMSEYLRIQQRLKQEQGIYEVDQSNPNVRIKEEPEVHETQQRYENVQIKEEQEIYDIHQLYAHQPIKEEDQETNDIHQLYATQPMKEEDQETNDIHQLYANQPIKEEEKETNHNLQYANDALWYTRRVGFE